MGWCLFIPLLLPDHQFISVLMMVKKGSFEELNVSRHKKRLRTWSPFLWPTSQRLFLHNATSLGHVIWIEHIFIKSLFNVSKIKPSKQQNDNSCTRKNNFEKCSILQQLTLDLESFPTCCLPFFPPTQITKHWQATWGENIS